MSYELIIFPWPLTAKCTLRLDDGTVLGSRPAVHHTGRLGVSFTIPSKTNQGHGCTLTLQNPGKVNITQRAILFLNDDILNYPWDTNQKAAFAADDFQMQDEKVCPEIPLVPPLPPPIPPLPPNSNPLDIIKSVYNTGLYNLATKDGCGKFTEACCMSLHIIHSDEWGYVKKIPPQNHYPEEPYVPGGKVHAVDAIMLLEDADDGTFAGVYDIIFSSESLDAKPAFNFRGPPDLNLWYYPA